MAKIVFIGAGSTVFTKNLVGDIFSYPALAESDITLLDIDEERLRTSEIVAQKLATSLDARPTIEATMDSARALEGADYALCFIQVAGYKPGTVTDFEIPKKYGLEQTIGDTLGIGGIMRGLRTVPVLLDYARQMESLCPDVTLLNYVNPMAINCWALNRATNIETIGLCHSVQGTAAQLARDIKVPIEAINYVCAGINHMAFYLRFEQEGRDLYPLIREIANGDIVPERAHETGPIPDAVRYELFRRLGYFVTESSEHLAEYTPWFIKRDRPDLIEQFGIPLDEYLNRCEIQIANWHDLRDYLESAETTVEHERSLEYGSVIINSMETGQPSVVYGNVTNHDLIENLPAECCVEVPCLVDQNGVQPTKIGRLPPQLAALMQTNINVQALTVEASLTGNREHIYHAAMLDPHTAAELSLDQIWAMVNELIEAHGSWLPEYNYDAI